MVYNKKYNLYVSKNGVALKLRGRWRDGTKHLEPCTESDNHGYVRVNTALGRRCLHRIVYETFVSEIPEGMEINHIDGNKSNNALDNLELVTHSENMKHAYRIGLAKTWNKGTKGLQVPWNKGKKGEDYKSHYVNGFSNQAGNGFGKEDN